MSPDQARAGSEIQVDGVPQRCWTLELEASQRACIRGTRAISAWALMLGIGPACRARIASACAEVLDNAARHAYPETGGELSLSVSRHERELRVTIEDRGVGMTRLPDLESAVRSATPAGLTRAASLCETIELESTPGTGTTVRMSFCIYQVFFEEEDRVDLSDLDYLPSATARTLLERIHRDGGHDAFFLSPALATTVGRLLIGPGGYRPADSTPRS